MFEEIPHESFDAREKRILDFWEKESIFKRSVDNRSSSPHFVHYDGPPFATGLPHYGHLLTSTIKDVVLRYKCQEGFYIPRRFGWDCHGLPVENEIEKNFGLSGAKSIEEFGIARFNEECRKIVLRYDLEWQKVITRIGRWVDFSSTYKTMDLPFMESVFWVFKELYDRGFIYEGFKVMPFSSKLGTPLSNFEASENYRDVDDPAITVKFPVVGEEKNFFLAWTTTPWTLVSNLALMVGPEIVYATIEDLKRDERYILAENRIASLYPDKETFRILKREMGKELAGRAYIPPFSYFYEKEKKGFRVILEPSVSVEEGTGIVHAAPAFGEVDFYACAREGIGLVCPVDVNGAFTAEVPEWEGRFVKDADKEIIRKLKENHLCLHHATINHRYPFCPRTDTPLIYKAVSSWFVAVEKIKETMVAANEEIHWTPPHIQFGRFGKWLEGARDWSISRNRYFGTPIPIWRAEDGEIHVIGSIQELEELTGAKIEDLHRHHIDFLTFEKKGKLFRRISEVFDCWFESGSMPYAQIHYPYENRELFEKTFPADFIAEGLDQTRGWFYTLIVISSILFQKSPFKNVIVNGIVLAENGTKMSKRLKNYPDPKEVIERYGADAIRLYMLHSAAVKADDLRFSEAGVELTVRQILLPMFNALSFFVTYANIYHFTPKADAELPENTLDQWILSSLQGLIGQIREGMAAYDLARAVEPLVGFINGLTNWYIRRSRRRFWSEEESQDRMWAFQTLYTVLIDLAKVAAPFIPFMAEAIWLQLRQKGMEESVHLTSFPKPNPILIDETLERGMDALQRVVSLGHSIRKEEKTKVRQPLSSVYIACQDPEILAFLEEEEALIQEELNVKECRFSREDHSFVTLKAKPQFRILGKKIGSKMAEAKEKILAFTPEELEEFSSKGYKTIHLGQEEIILTLEDVEIHREVRPGVAAQNEGPYTVALDLTITEALVEEGFAREIINKINTMRREAKFKVTDRIALHFTSTEQVLKSFQKWQEIICSETLTVELQFKEASNAMVWDINGEEAKIAITLHR